jgi:hypothetical protein
MKKTLLITIGALAFSLLAMSGTLNNGGSPNRKTGSPLDGANCTQCHTGAVIQANWISTSIPEDGWEPGKTYTVTLNASHSTAPKIGFELTSETPTEKTGKFTITDNTRTKLAFQSFSVTHQATGTTSSNGENSWEMQWTAPAIDKGGITFYAAFNAANGNGSTSGDTVYVSSLLVPQNKGATSVTANETASMKVFPNPASGHVFIEAAEMFESIEIFNLNGKMIKAYDNNASLTQMLDLSGIERGAYLVKANSGNQSHVRKLQINPR